MRYKRLSGGFDEPYSHQPGCERDPKLSDTADSYRPTQSPTCKEKVPAAIFPNPEAPPFRWPEAKPQMHGLDLSKNTLENAQAYFKWLCENEAGEWIYRKVDNVDGIFAMRNRPTYAGPQWQASNRFYMEDPWGQSDWKPARLRTHLGYLTTNKRVKYSHEREDYLLPEEGTRNYGGPTYFNTFRTTRGFEYFERPITAEEQKSYPGFKYLRFKKPWPEHPAFTSDFHDESFADWKRTDVPKPKSPRPQGEVWLWAHVSEYERLMALQPEPTNEIRSRYGLLWRGVERSPYDRKLSIGGGEEFVVDLQTNEILAMRRVFVQEINKNSVYSSYPKNIVSWGYGKTCPNLPDKLLWQTVTPADPLKRRGIDLKTAPTPQQLIRQGIVPNAAR